MAEDIFLNHSFIAQGAAISLIGGELRIVKNEFFGVKGSEETIIQLSDGNQSLKKLKITVDKTTKTAAIQEVVSAQEEELTERSADQSNDIILETDVDSSRSIDNVHGIVLETDVDSSIADTDNTVQERSIEDTTGIILEISSNENLDTEHQVFSLEDGKRLFIKYDEQEEKLVVNGAALDA